MDWQQVAALLIVGATVLAFAAARWRRSRQPKWARKTPCGCQGAEGACGRKPPGLIVRSRKGDSRPTIIESA